MTDTGAVSFSVSWGDTTDKGDLYVSEQDYNYLPNAASLNLPSGNGIVNVNWTEAGTLDDNTGDTIHYDVYGSADNGATYPYIVAKDLPSGTTNVQWDTLSDGIGLSGGTNCRVKLAIGDGFAAGDGSGEYSY